MHRFRCALTRGNCYLRACYDQAGTRQIRKGRGRAACNQRNFVFTSENLGQQGGAAIIFGASQQPFRFAKTSCVRGNGLHFNGRDGGLDKFNN